MTKFELSKAIAAKTCLTNEKAEQAIEAFISITKRELEKGNDVTLRGFATFTTKIRKAKKARIFSTGKTIVVPEHIEPVVKFCERLRVKVGKIK